MGIKPLTNIERVVWKQKISKKKFGKNIYKHT